MRRHELKIEPQYLDDLLSGAKKAEVRFNDRAYQTGDILVFKDYRGLGIPREYPFKITYVHPFLGMKEGFVCLSVEQQKEQDDKR